jgi:cytochrome c553
LSVVAPRQARSQAQQTTTALDESSYDPDNGEEINEICAGCHGEYGQGGGDGTYPRLAGMPAKYTAIQLRAFKSRERINIPMFPYATERELPEEDLRDISIFLSRIELYSKMPDLAEGATAYEKLLITKRVFNVARVEGDIEKGRVFYDQNCKKCHRPDGAGRGTNPPLAGQFTVYLRRQIDLFLSGERAHKNVDKYMRPPTDQDWNDLFAYLASVDD